MSVKDALLYMAGETRRRGANWRRRVDLRMQMFQVRLDELNRRLAKQSVPEGRRFSVGRLTLEEKATAARRKVKKPLKKSSD